MIQRLILFVTALALSCTVSFAADATSWKKASGLFAVFETTQGTFVCKLFEKETPKTVANFVGLAEGTKEFVDLKTRQPAKRRFYDGLIFHRVIPNFMIQGGDPLGKGFGGPGYQFEDEIVPSLTFDRPDLLAMANAGPGTNGSQFFITEAATPWLNGHHTIFGEVVEGQNVVTKISLVPRGAQDKPLTDVVITKISIERHKGATDKATGTLSGKKVLFVVAPQQFRQEEYFEPKRVLSEAGAEVVTASLKRGELIGTPAGTTQSDLLLEDTRADNFDAVVFIGGDGAQVYFKEPKALQLAKDAADKGKIVAAICIAPATLSNAGLLNNKKVAASPGVKAMIVAQGAVFSDAAVERDGNIITAAGPEASQKFGETIVQALSK